MKKVLFYPQNNSHVENYSALLESFKERQIEVSVVDTSSIYKQQLLLNRFGNNILKPKLSLSNSFYRIGLIDRIKAVSKLRHSLVEYSLSFDALIIGADGAFERILVKEFAHQNKQTIMILDGMISDYSVSWEEIFIHPLYVIPCSVKKLTSCIKRSVFKLFANTRLSPFLPGVIGMTPVNKIFLIGEHSKHVVSKYNKHSQIYAMGLPRFKYSPIQQHIDATNKLKVCYFPSAFKWHHLFKDDIRQHQDISLVCETLNEIKNKEAREVQLLIKIHPREDMNDYIRYKQKFSFVKLEMNVAIEDCFHNNSIFLTNLSTVIIEGLLCNINVYSLMIHFPYWKYKRSFLRESVIQKIYTKQELVNLLHNPIINNTIKDNIGSLCIPLFKPSLVVDQILKEI